MALSREPLRVHVSQTIKVGDHETKLTATYDLAENSEFLSRVSLSGVVKPPAAPLLGPVKLGYDLSHSFTKNIQAT